MAIAFCAGCLTLYWGQFTDEADNLVVGSLISRGYVLYRDVFSHHFPFPYYWVATIVSVFGKSILLARLSVWVFQILAFGIAIKLSGYHLSLGLAALFWSILHHMYLGNMVLYSPFCAASLIVVLAVSVSIVAGSQAPSWRLSLAIGLFSTIALLSDPLSVYAVFVALTCVLAKDLRQGVMSSLFTVTGLLGYSIYLLASGTFDDFLRDAVLFNSQVYSKYVYASPIRLRDLLEMSIRGLELADSAWLSFDPLKAINSEYSQFDRWFFTGFLFRFAVIASAIVLAFRRQFRASVLLYLFAAATLVISRWDFRGQPFILVSLVAMSALMSGEWWGKTENRVPRLSQAVLGALVGSMAIWLCLRVAAHTFVNRNLLLYETQFAGLEAESARIRQLTCNQPDALLAYFPAGAYFHWFTDMEPASRYHFMYPWVAEIGLSEVVSELSQEQVLAVVVRRDAIIWGHYDTKQYMRPLDQFLAEHYVEVDRGIYISPELSVQCQGIQE